MIEWRTMSIFNHILMPMYPKRINYLAYAFILSLTLWVSLFCLQITQWVGSDKISHFTAQVEFVVHFFTLLIIFPLYAKTNSEDRIVLKWFVLANVCLFLNDLFFYLAVYFPKNYILSASFFTFSIGYIPYLIWVSSIVIFLSKILVRDIFNLFDFFKALPFFILINVLIIFLFFSSVNHAFHYLTWEFISHLLSFMSEFIIFDFALLCLIYSENRGFSLSLLGCITLISGDFFISYSFLSQTSTFLNYGEMLWFLGLIGILFGIFAIYQHKDYSIKNWFSRTNTIKNRLAFWSFGTTTLSFLLFFIIAYFFSAIDKQLLLGLPLFVMMYSVIVVIFSIHMGKRFESPFKKLTANVEALMSNNDKSTIDDNFSTQEFIFLQKFIIDAFEVKEQKEHAQQALLSITAQLAHDIRSPLAAINTALSDVTSIPENKRIMIKNAAKRINDIANNLLLESKNNFFDSPDSHPDKNNSAELIFVLLDNIVAEKRYEYSKTKVNINLNSSDHSYNCFSSINLSSFKRVISNLINNSIEAINSDGCINISLSCNASHVEIIIEDDGCGIPPEILPKVTEQGFSFNKKNGAGLGLSYTKQYLEEIDGSMIISSDGKAGTKITINLIRATPPAWFCETLTIKSNSIVVLDDDPSIHEAWNERFAKISYVKIEHFSSASDFSHSIGACKTTLYLIDYELLADEKNGLDIIEEMQLNDRAILVTSSFEDLKLRTRCKNMGVKIIPKSYVPYIQIIQIPTNECNKFVFIDDDEMMRTTWCFAAEEAGIRISTYSSFDEFIYAMDNYSKNTIIYIDSDLGNNIKGELCAKTLFDKGFTEIHLTSGHPSEHFDDMPWIKTIVGKEPPFALTT